MDFTKVAPGKIVITHDTLPIFVPLCQLWNDIVAHIVDPWIRAVMKPERHFLMGLTVMYIAFMLACCCIVVTGPPWLWVVCAIFVTGWAICMVDISQRTQQYGTLVTAILSYSRPLRTLLTLPLSHDTTIHELARLRVRRNDLMFHLSRVALMTRVDLSREEVADLLRGCVPAFGQFLTSTPEELRKKLVSATAISRGRPLADAEVIPPMPAVPALPIKDVPPVPVRDKHGPAIPLDRYGRPKLRFVLGSIIAQRIAKASFKRFFFGLLKNSDILASGAVLVAALVRGSRKWSVSFLLLALLSCVRRWGGHKMIAP
eukprot:GEMP01022784.1.p1 GENE.GEMP01022784.1~~GEMP01022784.1.p1  ORF type:complete len:316 (+),score=68.75 GEMP01022784.1:172-1119(+)